jgi:mono/diheme cytochrome c family protein
LKKPPTMHLRPAPMTGSIGTGLGLLLGALLLAVLIVWGLYRWDVGAREAEAALRPAPVTALAPAAVTPVLPLSGASDVPAASTTVESSAADASAGLQVFTSKCNGCHPNANAGIGPALHGSAFASRYPDNTALLGVVRQGKGGMPAFTAAQLSDQDLANVVAYLRSLGTSEPEAESTPTPRPRVRGG